MFFMPLILLLTAGALISLGLTARIVLMGAQIFRSLTVAVVREPSSPEMSWSCQVSGILPSSTATIRANASKLRPPTGANRLPGRLSASNQLCETSFALATAAATSEALLFLDGAG